MLSYILLLKGLDSDCILLPVSIRAELCCINPTFSTVLQLVLGDSISHWTWSPVTQLEWLVNELWRASCTHPDPSAGVSKHFHMVLEIWTQDTVLIKQALCHSCYPNFPPTELVSLGICTWLMHFLRKHFHSDLIRKAKFSMSTHS